MILTEVYIRGFGPYSEGAELEIENDVTILTGANDTGKTITLRLMSLMDGKQKAAEDDKNEHAYDDESGVFFTFQVGETDNADIGSVIDKIELLHDPEGGSLDVNRIFDRMGNEIEDHSVIGLQPKVIWIRAGEEIRSEFQVHRANSTERLLLQMAFDTVDGEVLKGMSSSQYRRINERLSQNLSSIVSPHVGLKFRLQPITDDVPKIAVDLEDSIGSTTSIQQRGSGYNRLISYLLLISSFDLDSGSVILLIDEPETSLHADAQHTLRYYLEKIASRPNVQIIYATHSSAMMNPLRPRCLRLLQREKRETGNATTRIDNEPYKSRSYSLVRNSLGMTPSDSLLFSAITIIVEGITEELAFSRLLDRLVEEWEEGRPENLDMILGQVHLVNADGFGDIHKFAIYALSQGSQPIAFVDGDVVEAVQDNLDAYREINGKVPLIHVSNERELEEVVAIETYFNALAAHIEPSEEVTVDKFNEWYEAWKADNNEDISKFSGRVQLWIYCKFPGQRYYKDKVMLEAVNQATIDELQSPEVIKLIDVIRETLEKLTSPAAP